MLTNADASLAARRIHKDTDEIADLRKAIAISEAALAELYDSARAGDTEAALAARLKQAMLAHGTQGFAFKSIVLSGPNAADPYAQQGQVEGREIHLVDTLYQRIRFGRYRFSRLASSQRKRFRFSRLQGVERLKT